MALSVGAVFVGRVTRVSVWSKAMLALAGMILLFRGGVVSLTAYVLFGLL